MKNNSIPITDNCKYYFIYGSPINAAYLVHGRPFFDTNDKYYIQAVDEYNKISDMFGDDGVKSFVENIANLSALGCIDGRQILQCIHQYSTKTNRKEAFRKYDSWKKSRKYSHQVKTEDGDYITEPCTEYIAHLEQNAKVYYERETKNQNV